MRGGRAGYTLGDFDFLNFGLGALLKRQPISGILLRASCISLYMHVICTVQCTCTCGSSLFSCILRLPGLVHSTLPYPGTSVAEGACNSDTPETENAG